MKQILFGLLLFVSSLGASAADKLPVANLEELRAYALDKAKWVSMYLSSEFGTEPAKGDSYFQTEIDGGLSAIMAAPSQAKLSTGIVDPGQRISIRGYVLDSRGHYLFSGGSPKSVVVAKGGGYKLNDTSLSMELQSKIWFDFGTDVAWVDFVATNKWGGADTVYSVNYKWDEQEEGFYIPISLVDGSMGNFDYVQIVDGDYNDHFFRRDGTEVIPEDLITGVSVRIMDTLVYTDTDVLVEVPSYHRSGVNPTIEVNMSTARSVKVSGVTSEGKFAKSVTIWVDGQRATYTLDKMGFIELDFNPGRYYIYFNWDPEDFRVYGGGMG